ncbi:5-formyltetrahydrofolate cyclo-ligase [Litorihabitans aurantiacus]|uniref:5-formyltetrahydrofolate cyclo-ligase n=1 Tax=Litorihabitans aurantiacus TaxID=1930061 RepID=UPI0024E187CE|nr:5-formyltetrahydrofolate cyclo-ligase [Litorihabitans aurantiacus]
MTGNDAHLPAPRPTPDHPHPDAAAPSLIAIEQLEDAKDDLRAAIKDRRSQLDRKALDSSARDITQQVLALTATLGLGAGDTVAAYVSRHAEPGTLPTLEALHAAGLEVLVPVLGPALDRCWGVFTGQDDLAQLAPGRPLEPRGTCEEATAVGRARLVLCPALAIDDAGVRLGLGGGWYDRALLHADPAAHVVGVVYDEEANHPPLPRAPHDVPVHGVLTPTSWWQLPAA